jgi:hypothetical protein
MARAGEAGGKPAGSLCGNDLHLGILGTFPESSQIHVALGRLSPGDRLAMRALEGNGIGLLTGPTCVLPASRAKRKRIEVAGWRLSATFGFWPWFAGLPLPPPRSPMPA